MTDHASRNFEPDEEGWWFPRCSCGWEWGFPTPDAETCCDVLMEHAATAAAKDERERRPA